MPKFLSIFAIASALGSSAGAQTASCQTDDPNCQGYATFGPASVDRCISVRGETSADFCQQVGDSQRLFIHSGDQYCAVFGSDPVPAQCDLHWITVTEPE
jgi:hypothetical protein